MIFTSDVKANTLIVKAGNKGLRVATAESCTGGLVAAALTDVPGSSAVFDRGFVTYSNAAKIDLLGVPAALIDAHGAVSAETAAYLVDVEHLDRFIADAMLREETRSRIVAHDDGVMVLLKAMRQGEGFRPEDMISLRVWIDAC